MKASSSFALLIPLTFLVAGCPGQPAVGVPGDGTSLSIGAVTFREATLGVYYAGQLSVAGEHAGEARWTIKDGALPPGLALDSSSGSTVRVAGTPTQLGTFNFTAAVSDAFSDADTRAFTLVVSEDLAIAGTLPSAKEGQLFSATLSAKGGHGKSFSWNGGGKGLPRWMTMTPSNDSVTISGTPPAGAVSFQVAVINEKGETATRSFMLDAISVLAVTTDTVPPASQNAAWSLGVSVAGGVGNYHWLITGAAPPGISITDTSNATTVVSGTPTQTGTFIFSVNASDDNGGAASVQVTMTVAPALQITTTHLPDGQVGVAYSATVSATGGDSTAYTWSQPAGQLPVPMKPGTGPSRSLTLGGYPFPAGTYTFTLQVSTPDGASAQQSYTVVISANPPTIDTDATLPGATWGKGYSTTISGTDHGGLPTYSVVGGTLPPGLYLSTTTSRTKAQLYGTPAMVGTFSFTIQMTDAAGGTEKTFSLTVARAPGIEVASALLPAGRAGLPYSAGVSCIGNSGAVTWSVDSGALPAGLTLTNGSGCNATLSGTPANNGWSTFTLRAADGSDSDAKAFAIRVAPARVYAGLWADDRDSITGVTTSSLGVREIEGRTPGAATQLFTANVGPYSYPQFSPSGDWIVQTRVTAPSSGDLYYDLGDLPLSEPPLVEPNFANYTPQWSPDGMQTLMQTASNTLTLEDLRVPAMPTPTAMTVTPQNPGAIAWAPDSTRYAYWSDDGATLYVSGRVIAMPSGLTGPSVGLPFRWQAWVADGEGVIFQGRQKGALDDQIFFIGAEGGLPVALTDVGVSLVLGEFRPSPDGRGVVFMSVADASQQIYDLWYLDLGSRQLTGAVKVSSTPRNYQVASWSPDSQALLLLVAGNTTTQLTIDRAQIGVSEPVTLTAGSLALGNAAVSWGADSSRLMVASATSGLYEVARDGSAQQLLDAKGSAPSVVSASRRAYVYLVPGKLMYVVASDATPTPAQIDVDDASIAVGLSSELQAAVYIGNSRATYLVDLSGATPGTPAQLFTPPTLPTTSSPELGILLGAD